MAFTPPTNDEFRAHFSPVFDNTDEDKITLAISLGMRMVDTQNWTEGDYARGIETYAAHFLSVDASAASSGGANGTIQSESLGSISVSYATPSSEQSDVTGLSSTIYGREFAMLQMLNVGGARSI